MEGDRGRFRQRDPRDRAVHVLPRRRRTSSGIGLLHPERLPVEAPVEIHVADLPASVGETRGGLRVLEMERHVGRHGAGGGFEVLGVPLEEVIRRVTVSPAEIIRRPELGTLSVGAEADLAVIELLRGKFGYTDCGWTKIIGDAKLENRLTLRAGQIIYDPTGLSAVAWQNAPAQYFTSPKFQNTPRATAHPEYLRRLNNSAK